jgi:hypothetical protein
MSGDFSGTADATTMEAFGGTVGKAADERERLQKIDVIAELGWQSHIAWERIIGEQQKPDWRDLSTDEVMRLEESVRWLIDHPTSSVSAQHDAWRARMSSRGLIENEHPNMVPFDELPFSQQMKARLWRHIIFAVFG